MAQRKHNVSHQRAYVQRQEELGRKPRRIFATDDENTVIKSLLEWWRKSPKEEQTKLMVLLMKNDQKSPEKT